MSQSLSISNAHLYVYFEFVGKLALETLEGAQRELAVVAGFEIRQVEVDQSRDSLSYGVIGDGAELMRLAWHSMKHVFSVRHQGDMVVPLSDLLDMESEVFLGPN